MKYEASLLHGSEAFFVKNEMKSPGIYIIMGVL